MMSAYATEGNLLVRRIDIVDECFVGKTAIVAMVVLDADTMFRCVSFKSMFGLDGFDGGE